MTETTESDDTGLWITPTDLEGFVSPEHDLEDVRALCEDATSTASFAAPELRHPPLEPGEAQAVRAVLRAAVVRWFNGSGVGLSSVTAGPFAQSFDNSGERRGVLWPSEVQALRAIRPRPTIGSLDLAARRRSPLPRSQDPRLWQGQASYGSQPFGRESRL